MTDALRMRYNKFRFMEAFVLRSLLTIPLLSVLLGCQPRSPVDGTPELKKLSP